MVLAMAACPETYDEAISNVKARVASSRTSFHAGMAILPKKRREAMYALYAFCREVDDIADDSPTPAESEKGLLEWRHRIAELFQGKATDPITLALLPAVSSFDLVEKDFQDIIDGMAMDAAVLCAPDEQTLDLYCDRVASAVGRVSVRIFGDSSPAAMEVAFHLGRALQLTNILRDLSEDAVRGRLYLPDELLTRHAIDERLPINVLQDINLRFACRELGANARRHFDGADRAMARCDPTAMRPARIMRAYYGAIFDRLVTDDWRSPLRRVSLSKVHKIWLALRHVVS